MSAESMVQIALMAFVLLAPTLMVAVLVSGLSRRAEVATDVAEAVTPVTPVTPVTAAPVAQTAQAA